MGFLGGSVDVGGFKRGLAVHTAQRLWRSVQPLVGDGHTTRQAQTINALLDALQGVFDGLQLNQLVLVERKFKLALAADLRLVVLAVVKVGVGHFGPTQLAPTMRGHLRQQLVALAGQLIQIRLSGRGVHANS